MRDSRRRIVALAATAGLCGSVLVAAPASGSGSGSDHGSGPKHHDSVKQLTKAVTLKGVLRHSDAFQAIANRNDGTRASGSSGFDKSADYVARQLTKSGYKVTRQAFDFAFFQEFSSSFAQTAPTPTEYANGVSYDLMDHSGAGDVTAEVVPVDINLTPLEVAIQMAKYKTSNRVRFAFWGAEEANLVGSTFYVDSLTEEQVSGIALYLNFDMVASPNYVFAVYDGDGSDNGPSGPGPEGSAAIEKVFEKFYDKRGLSHEGTDFDGRSDYGPFIGVDIPAGGLFTGAEKEKTAEQVARYGGVVGAPLDPCYHAACDSLSPVRDGADRELYRKLARQYRLYGNLNTFALDTNADAIATAVLTFARDTSTVNAVWSSRSSAKARASATLADAHGLHTS